MGVRGPDLGVGLPLDRPIEEVLEAARVAEDLGYGFAWATDDRLQRDVFAILAAASHATERILLGPGVTNPYVRHPALIASAVATLDELSGGRAVLGLGAGGTSHGMLGVERRAPATALREAVSVIRALLAGEELTLDGRTVRARRAKLDFRPSRVDVPIYIGARGPRVLELAGEVADGVILGNLATEAGLRYALRHVSAGAERAGRGLEDLSLVAWLYCSLSEDPREAVEAVRPMVATSLVTSRPILHELGIDLPASFASLMEAAAWSPARDAVMRAAGAVPDELISGLALAGTPRDCRERLTGLLDAFPELTQVAIVPLPPPGHRLADIVRIFGREVASVSPRPASRSG